MGPTNNPPSAGNRTRLGRPEPFQQPRHRPARKAGRQLQHVDETDRTEAGDHADHDRQDDEVILLREKRGAQPHPRPIPDADAGRHPPAGRRKRGDDGGKPLPEFSSCGHGDLALDLDVGGGGRRLDRLHDRELHALPAPQRQEHRLRAPGGRLQRSAVVLDIRGNAFDR